MQQTLKLPELELRAETVRNKPVMLQVGLEPDGFQEWLAAQATGPLKQRPRWPRQLMPRRARAHTPPPPLRSK